MLLGGLEIVAGGYLLHRHYRKKNEKETLQYDAQKNRHQTFPGANHCPQQPYQQQQQTGWYTQVPPQPTLLPASSSKYACYAIAPQPRPQIYTPQTQPLPQQHVLPPAVPPPSAPYTTRPHAPPHTQSFTIPRRPVPERKPQIIIQPSLQRTDSFATLSRMPVANGSRPHDLPGDEEFDQREEYRKQNHSTTGTTGGVGAAGAAGLYGNTRYAASTPAFGATPTSPGLRYEMATGAEHQVYDGEDWYAYHTAGGGAAETRPHYAPTVSTELGEREPPPPPYVP